MLKELHIVSEITVVNYIMEQKKYYESRYFHNKVTIDDNVNKTNTSKVEKEIIWSNLMVLSRIQYVLAFTIDLQMI